MVYSYGGRVDNDSNAITKIDEENRTAETTGYVNGEYVEFSGGGGSSDFSTAILTILHGDTDLSAAAILNKPDLGLVGSWPVASASVEADAEAGVENVIILYKGKAYIPDPNHYGHEVLSGDIEWNSDMQSYIITGDCSIDYGELH